MQGSVSQLLHPQADQLGKSMSSVIIVIALLVQICLPLFSHEFGLLDVPLLVVVYVVLNRRKVVSGLMIGGSVGLMQDALTHGPMGLFGIIKTVIGYLAGSTSLVIEMSYPGARSVLAALFFVVQQLMFWLINGVLLANEVDFNLSHTLIMASAHAGLSLALYPLLDRLKKTR